MSKDKRKKFYRVMNMIRELNARTWFYGRLRSLPTISRKPGKDMSHAIKKGYVKLRRRYHSGTSQGTKRVGRTVVDTGFFDGCD